MPTIQFLRSFRFGEYAYFDFIAAFLGIYLLSPLLVRLFLSLRVKTSKKTWLFLTLPLSILIHLLVHNITPMTRDFMDLHGHYGIKILTIGLLIKETKEKN
ncbi:MAG: hypothetical protein NTZ55_05110 [Candidatus Roizmanbacteria bacterium]|nr:hypothetical protein [Candidatus Roizmanbacteria bacterium]